MRRSLINIGTSAFVVLMLCNGCAMHRVKYVAFVKNEIEPTEQARSLDGSFDEAKALFEKADLPHNTVRDNFELRRRAMEALTSQLGSDDYMLIGEVYGGGNAYANAQTLRRSFCKKAARKGGDVVLIFKFGVTERPYVFRTPGYSTTNVSGSAYSYGNYAYGSATAHTTYNPGQTFAGVLRLPQGNGLVFKYIPGLGQRRAALNNLPDPQLKRVLEILKKLGDDKRLSLNEALNQWDGLMRSEPAIARHNDQPVSAAHASPTAPWQQLRAGMTPTQVKNLLGEPSEVSEGKNSLVWFYHDMNNSHVAFRGGSVASWRGP